MRRVDSRITSGWTRRQRHESHVSPLQAALVAWVLCLWGGLGCASSPGLQAREPEVASQSLAGVTIRYRFLNGRTYRAAYRSGEVDFLLLEPVYAEPPGQRMPYRAVTLRDDLFLVVWDDPVYHATFVIDLAQRRLHASSQRPSGERFLGVAEILDIAR